MADEQHDDTVTAAQALREIGFTQWSKKDRENLGQDLANVRAHLADDVRRRTRRKALVPVFAFVVPAMVTIATWIGSSLASHPVYINYTPPAITAPPATPIPTADQP